MTFLWTVVILMATALLAEIFALVGLAIASMHAARRGKEITDQVTQKAQPAISLVKELNESLRPQMETVTREGKEIVALVSARSHAINAAFGDASRRAERIRLRFTDGVQTVDGRKNGRGIYREVVEPIQTASQVVRGLKLAFWIMRKVA